MENTRKIGKELESLRKLRQLSNSRARKDDLENILQFLMRILESGSESYMVAQHTKEV